jgi:hypothetical protein
MSLNEIVVYNYEVIMPRRAYKKGDSVIPKLSDPNRTMRQEKLNESAQAVPSWLGWFAGRSSEKRHFNHKTEYTPVSSHHSR